MTQPFAPSFFDHIDAGAQGNLYRDFASSFAGPPEAEWLTRLDVHAGRSPEDFDYIRRWWRWCQWHPEFADLVAFISARPLPSRWWL